MADEVRKSDTIESLLAEDRTYPPPAEFTANALLSDADVYAEAEADVEGFWAEQAGELLDWYEPWDTVLEWDLPFAKWFVGGTPERVVQLPRPARRRRAGRQGRVPLGGRARRHPHHHLRRAPARRRPARQRAEGARRREGRPGQHLPRHGAGAADGAARVRAHRRRALRGLRRLLLRLAPRPHPGRRGEGAHHRRRRLAPRAASCRSRRPPTLAVAECPTIEKVLVLRRTEHDVPMTDGRDVWWHDLVPAAVGRLRARADGRRRPPLPALHQRHHGAAQGHHAHDRRLPHPGRVDAQERVRSPRPTPTSTGARPTSAG